MATKIEDAEQRGRIVGELAKLGIFADAAEAVKWIADFRTRTKELGGGAQPTNGRAPALRRPPLTLYQRISMRARAGN